MLSGICILYSTSEMQTLLYSIYVYILKNNGKLPCNLIYLFIYGWDGMGWDGMGCKGSILQFTLL